MPDSDPRTSESLALLLRALVSLDDPTAALALLQDLCTPRELEDLSQRLEVARMLDAGVSYARIQAATGASATTTSTSTTLDSETTTASADNPKTGDTKSITVWIGLLAATGAVLLYAIFASRKRRAE